MGLFKFFKNIFAPKASHTKNVDNIYNSTTKISEQESPSEMQDSITYYLCEVLGLTISEKTLIKLAKNTDKYYTTFYIPKKRGGIRRISAPSDELLEVQRRIYKNILAEAPVHKSAKGFLKATSVVDNAKEHLNNHYMLKVDIWSFFGSIRINKIIPIFLNLGYTEEESKILAQLCTFGGRLPQGAPTSPVLSNIVCYSMDNELSSIADEFNLKYTRYADDMVFSGNSFDSKLLLKKINKVISKNEFLLNEAKTQYSAIERRKIVTGISISSGKMTIPRAKKRELRQTIYHIRTKGLEEHMRTKKSCDPAYLRRIIGYLNFWLHVEPNNQYIVESKKYLLSINKK